MTLALCCSLSIQVPQGVCQVLATCTCSQALFAVSHLNSCAHQLLTCLPCRSDGFFYFYFVVAVAAACVASQTMVSAAFSIVKQSMMLNCFPRMRVIYTNVKVSRLLGGAAGVLYAAAGAEDAWSSIYSS